MLGRAVANDLDPSGSQGAKIVARSPLGLRAGEQCHVAAAAIVEILDQPFAGMLAILLDIDIGMKIILDAGILESVAAFPALARGGVLGRDKLVKASRLVGHIKISASGPAIGNAGAFQSMPARAVGSSQLPVNP